MLLLLYGADPNILDNYDQTPFIKAVLSEDFKIIERLLVYGADPMTRNKQGLTVFDLSPVFNDFTALQEKIKELKEKECQLKFNI